MRDPAVAFYVVSGLLIASSAWLIRARSGRVALASTALQALVWGVVILAYPPFLARQADKASLWAFVAGSLGLIAAVGVGALARPRVFERLEHALLARPRLQNIALAGMSVLLALSGLEFVTGALRRADVVRRYTPTETVVANASADWRLHHIMSDEFREPDPVLLWKPVARAPYGSQRFRGPVIPERRPDGWTRVFCYGDSNTDGPPEGGAWPEPLDRLARSKGSFEVVNAGVTGYSSYQGLRRLEQELPVYRPDIVVVSFGWNDAATALSTSDKAFGQSAAFNQVRPEWLPLRRLLLNYDSLSVMTRLVTPARTFEQAVSGTLGPRVSLADYRENLQSMVDQTQASGGRVVLLTRPHRESVEALETSDGWRQTIPAYNDVVREVAAETSVSLVDAARVFETQPEAFVDESHLTREGHESLAEQVMRELAAAGLEQ